VLAFQTQGTQQETYFSGNEQGKQGNMLSPPPPPPPLRTNTRHHKMERQSSRQS
jgi:hypothetical protein